MQEKRSFKVISSIPKQDGGHFWMRLGSAYTNKDGSINVYLDAIPRDNKFQLRELDEEDLRKREAYRTSLPARSADPPPL